MLLALLLYFTAVVRDEYTFDPREARRFFQKHYMDPTQQTSAKCARSARSAGTKRPIKDPFLGLRFFLNGVHKIRNLKIETLRPAVRSRNV